MLAPPIFPGRRQPGIVGRNELNYRVRNGNGWTLALIGTNFVGAKSALFRFRQPASGCPAKTALRSFAPPFQPAPLDFELVSEERWPSLLYVIRQKPENKLDYKLFKLPCQEKNGDPYRIRTDVNGVRGRCLNHLTNGPYRLTLQCGNLSFPQIRCAPWAHLTQGWCTFTDSNRGPTD